jgi:hypothetical protein
MTDLGRWPTELIRTHLKTNAPTQKERLRLQAELTRREGRGGLLMRYSIAGTPEPSRICSTVLSPN